MKAFMRKHCFKRTATAALLGTSVAAASVGICAAENDPMQIETIVVTAQKRKENVQDVPISVTAFSADKLDKIGAVGLEDIARNTPGLYFEKGYNQRELMPAIRGVSSTSWTAGADPAVGIYIDEVYMGGPAGSAIDLFDIERVEVLRGPQGTLFGRNTTGGVISVTSKRPSNNFEGYLQTEFGNYEHIRIKGGVSGPIQPGVLTGSISALSFDRKGFLTSAPLGRDVNDTHQRGLRGSLLLTATKNSEWLATFDYMTANQSSGNNETLKNYPQNQMFLPAGTTLPNTNPWDRTIFNVNEGKEIIEAQGLSVRGRISFDHFDLISISAFRKHRYYDAAQNDATPVNVGYYSDPEKARRFTQELRLESTGKNPLQWIVGAYYLHQNSRMDGDIYLQGALADMIGIPKDPFGSHANSKGESSSVFGSMSYQFNDRFNASFGGRYTKDEKTIDYYQTDPFGIVGGSSVYAGSKKFTSFTPSITGRFKLAKDVMTYATYSEGYKAGGYTEGLKSAAAPIQYDPEKVKNFEIGFKSRFLENRLQFNAALFHLKWDNMQIRQDDPTTATFDPIISNAGKAKSDGGELELTAKVTKEFSLGTSLAFLDAKFTSGPYTGKEVLRAPKHTVGLNAEYKLFSTSNYDITARGDLVYTSPFWFKVTDNALGANNPLDSQTGYTLVNARITYADVKDVWRVSVWGKNLTDKNYKTNVFDLSTNPFAAQYYMALGAPRTLGVDVRYNF